MLRRYRTSHATPESQVGCGDGDGGGDGGLGGMYGGVSPDVCGVEVGWKGVRSPCMYVCTCICAYMTVYVRVLACRQHRLFFCFGQCT